MVFSTELKIFITGEAEPPFVEDFEGPSAVSRPSYFIFTP
jgi:hypothetical protein